MIWAKSLQTFAMRCSQGEGRLTTEEDPVMLGQHLPVIEMSFQVRC